jgi:hypothetical protein
MSQDGVHHPSPTPEHVGEGIAQWIERHLALITSVGGVLVIATKLSVVSHYRIDTALALLDAASAVSLVAGALILSLPLLAAWALFLTSAYLLPSLKDNHPINLALLLTWIIAGLLSPFPVVLVYGVVALVLTGRRLLADQGRVATTGPVDGATASEQQTGPRASPLGSVGFFLSALVVLTFFLIDDRVWLPAESIGVPDGSEFVVYAVGERGGWTVVLDHADRTIRYIRTDSIRERRVCSTEEGSDVLFSLPTPAQLLVRIRAETIEKCPAR